MTLLMFIAGLLTGIALPVMAYAAYQGIRIAEIKRHDRARWTRA